MTKGRRGKTIPVVSTEKRAQKKMCLLPKMPGEALAWIKSKII